MRILSQRELGARADSERDARIGLIADLTGQVERLSRERDSLVTEIAGLSERKDEETKREAFERERLMAEMSSRIASLADSLRAKEIEFESFESETAKRRAQADERLREVNSLARMNGDLSDEWHEKIGAVDDIRDILRGKEAEISRKEEGLRRSTEYHIRIKTDAEATLAALASTAQKTKDELSEREAILRAGEQVLSAEKRMIEASRAELAERDRQVRDRYETLERTIKRLSK